MRLTTDEITQWQLTEDHREDARRALLVEGYVVFEGVLSASKVSTLHERFMGLFDLYMHEIGDNRGRQRQGGVPLPIDGDFADPEVIGNPLVMDLIGSLLGPDIVCTYFASDTPLPGSEYQPIHRDGNDLFPGVPVTLPSFMYELNIPLVDFTEQNGPTEIWPRTHLVTDFPLLQQKRDELRVGNGQVKVTTESGRPNMVLGSEGRGSDVQDFADALHGQPVLMPAGSFLVRDPRMWHRGTPNRSDAARPMLSLAYGRPWYRFNAVNVSHEVYEAWPESVRDLFRLACIEGELSREFA